jgi:intron-binding protein aquarius
VYNTLFLICIITQYFFLLGVKYIRGGEVFEIRGEDDTVLNDYGNNSNDRSKAGNKRRFRLKLDCAQYHQDIESGINCYEGLNLLIRRDSRENNFKATLETIRNLMNMSAVGDAIPRWLHDVFLGYGNPAAANYR